MKIIKKILGYTIAGVLLLPFKGKRGELRLINRRNINEEISNNLC